MVIYRANRRADNKVYFKSEDLKLTNNRMEKTHLQLENVQLRKTEIKD